MCITIEFDKVDDNDDITSELMMTSIGNLPEDNWFFVWSKSKDSSICVNGEENTFAFRYDMGNCLMDGKVAVGDRVSYNIISMLKCITKHLNLKYECNEDTNTTKLVMNIGE